MDNTPLAGQVALVTGASQGIGYALAFALASRGASVAGMARSSARLEAAMQEIADSTGSRTLALAADVAAEAAVRDAVERGERELGPIDLLVNSAGLVDAAEVPIWETDPDQWWSVVESHIRGAYLTARAVVPSMVARGHGRVVNLASGMGTRPQPEYSAYSVGKAGQMRLTECLAESLQGTGVYAFNIAPGLVETDMTRSMPKWAGHTAWTPPEKVVELVCGAAAGDLDAWHGRFLRAGVDLPDVVKGLEPTGGQRQLRLQTYGPDDPMG
jgi:NAD(P)-dependent dehydrogenase (short-subunit alcohol dehydrogenase family)